ncbi:PEP-CTERM sorting domain-containing protein [Paucibacter sp. TC2R-5]|uniref:PEP-CTERM sorting domain-containing protein n=1 Tax=Paucibacter sp. TC2R-5 TaxID=2893555 RepID=UPI0021E3A96F|nr:PEP-CTERM sorting domain-containing protein [Paucibacter sp. TC2R-5]MCV2360200.1 PEP-CTERM sorting domain-containing protein [Paucibacter sp. TC2R-5]
MNFQKIAFAALLAASFGAANATVAKTTPVVGTTVYSENFNGGSSFTGGYFNAFGPDDYMWLSALGATSSSYSFTVGALASLDVSFNYKALGNTSTVSLTGPQNQSWNLSSTGLGFLIANPGANNGKAFSMAPLNKLAAGDYSLNFATSGLAGVAGLKVDDVTITIVAAPVPEPQTYALMVAGLAAVGFVARRRRPA